MGWQDGDGGGGRAGGATLTPGSTKVWEEPSGFQCDACNACYYISRVKTLLPLVLRYVVDNKKSQCNTFLSRVG